MTSRREDYTCEQWIYGPQMSKKNASYSVGAKAPYKWNEILNECINYNSRSYFEKLKHITIDRLLNSSVNSQELIKKELEECNSLEVLLLIHSVFVIAFGKLFATKKNREELCVNYQYFYDNVESILNKYTYLIRSQIFTIPENFKYLNNQDTPRPPNIFSIAKAAKIEEILEKIKNTNTTQTRVVVKSHPINAKCDIFDKVTDCTTKFGESGIHPYFKPLSDTFVCHCSFLKHKLVKTNNINQTHNFTTKQRELSKGDIQQIKLSSSNFNNSLLPAIVIRKYKFNEDNVCHQKTYLSQLFEKCCTLFYKPTYITPSNKEELFDTARDNLLLGFKNCGGFHDGTILNKFFSSSITHISLDINGEIVNNTTQRSNTPVYFIIEDTSRLYYDIYIGPVFQFYGDVMKELMEYKVFVPSSTLFSNDRYVLNMNFDIETLEFYKKFPAESKTPELKKEITEYFFRYVGNIIHFALANNIELPFKLSRIYIMQLFGIFDFTEYTPSKGYLIDTKLDYKLLLISTYLIEKASPTYHKLIMDIFKNPELLKNPTQELIDAFNGGETGSIHMNGFNTLTDAPDENPEYLYKEGDSISDVLIKMIEFLYKTAFKSYFENQTKQNEPLNKNFKINRNIHMLFEGFRSTKEFGENQSIKLLPSLSYVSKLEFKHKLAYIRKADIYLSGFGITHETIQTLLIPKIKLLSLTHAIQSLSDYLKQTTITMDYLNNIKNDAIYKNITNADVKKLVDKGILLFKVLLSRGKNIPIEFINGYNEKMFQTTIPPQIMKIIIEQDSATAVPILAVGSVNISNVIQSTKKITTIITTSDKRIIIPRGAKATYTYTPVSSGHQQNMTDDDYHNEFVKFLLKFWSASPNIGNSTYTISYQSENASAGPNDLIIAGTCFLKISPRKIYKHEDELYEDLVKSVIHTRFGELLGGKKKPKILKKRLSSKHKK